MPPGKTPPPKKRKQYADEEMQNAILAVRSGVETVSSAAKRFGVPRVTLHDKISGRYEESCRLGRKPLLSDEEEDVLVKWILGCKTKGFPVTKDQLIYSAGRMLTRSGKPNPFIKEKPGRRWYELFMGRHKNLAVRECQTLTTSRASITKESVTAWCEEVRTYCQENDLMDIFKDHRRVFNCDETAFFLSPKKGKVIAARGDRSVYNVSGNTDKENVTVLMTVRADGAVAPPMILYAYERIPLQVGMAVPDGWGLGKSESGWMTSETFFEYMANTFEPYLTSNNIPRPVVMFMDGHVSHMSLELSEFCATKEIQLVALLPNATHLLQPLDVAVFHPLKNAWKKAVSQWRFEHASQKLRKEDFPPMLQSVMETKLKPETIQNGFKTCGLVTLDTKDIDITKIVGNLAQKPKTQTTVKAHSDETEKIQNFLIYLERKIGEDKLKGFRRGGPIKRRDESLFEVWRSIRQDLRISISDKSSTDSNTAVNPIVAPLTFDNGNSDHSNHEEDLCSESVDDPDPMMGSNIEEQNVLIDFSADPDLDSQGIVIDEGLFNDLGLDLSMPIELDLPVTVMPEPVENIQPNSDSPPPTLIYTSAVTPTAINPLPTTSRAVTPTPTSQPAISPLPTTSRAVTPTPTSQPAISHPQPQPSTSAEEDIKSCIPSPFKNCVFWPGPKKESDIKKKKNTVKVPSVVTSIKWKEYHRKLAAEKARKEKELEERRERRKKQQEMKEQTVKIKKEQKLKIKKEKCSVPKLKLNDSPQSEAEEDNPQTSFDIDSFPGDSKPRLEDFSVGQWVIVPYKASKTQQAKRFIGQILSMDTEEKTGNIKFLVQKGNQFIWPVVDDIDEKVPLGEIIKILSEPVFDRRGHLSFVP